MFAIVYQENENTFVVEDVFPTRDAASEYFINIPTQGSLLIRVSAGAYPGQRIRSTIEEMEAADEEAARN